MWRGVLPEMVANAAVAIFQCILWSAEKGVDLWMDVISSQPTFLVSLNYCKYLTFAPWPSPTVERNRERR
jgi:hypothetical protein